ncbi:hypothetical protein H5410_004889 [Solanum commersonii]|uniref:Uncharacterized protein n=1 Tax=Solanum commersonii TaxID=4109 RepID=A0A9J6A6I9_SOLCO|nr:hypothetical protein H5410_004889 [Solanum commersonii]
MSADLSFVILLFCIIIIKGRSNAWAFETIPYLRKLFKDYLKEISQPRILRWLFAKNNPKINYVDFFDSLHDIIVHP